MATIKINGNDKEFIDLSQNRIIENSHDKNHSDPEFKINAELLEAPEVLKPKIIKNLE